LNVATVILGHHRIYWFSETSSDISCQHH